jgi:DNA-binding GntR family transcriptional regulator
MAVPTYLLIAADLRSKIGVGKMRPGTQLPPEKNLQDEYGKLSGAVSRNTVRDAIEMLVREGLLEKRRGQGTFIVGTLDSLPGYTPPTWPDPASSSRCTWTSTSMT